MASDRSWTIKGVGDRTRAAAAEAAHGAGLTIGEWIDQVLAKAAEEARSPRPPAATRAEMAEVVREALSEQLAPLTERLAALEEKVSRPTRPEPPAASPVEAVRTRLRLRRGFYGLFSSRFGASETNW